MVIENLHYSLEYLLEHCEDIMGNIMGSCETFYKLEES